MVDFLNEKTPIFPANPGANFAGNDTPVTATSTQASNAADLIAKCNQVIDFLQPITDGLMKGNYILGGLEVVPISGGVRILAGQYCDSNLNIYDIAQQDITTGLVADTAGQLVILNYSTGVGKVEQLGYSLVANEIVLASFSTQLVTGPPAINFYKSIKSENTGNLATEGFRIDITTHPDGTINPAYADDIIAGKSAGFNPTHLRIQAEKFLGNTYELIVALPATPYQLDVPDFTGWTDITGSVLSNTRYGENLFSDSGLVTAVSKIAGTLTGFHTLDYYYGFQPANSEVVEIESRYTANTISSGIGGGIRLKQVNSLLPLGYFEIPKASSFEPFYKQRTYSRVYDTYFEVTKETATTEGYTQLFHNYFEFYDENRTSGAYGLVQFQNNLLYFEQDNGVDTDFAMQYNGSLELWGTSFNSKVKLNIAGNGSLELGGTKVVDNQQAAIASLTNSTGGTTDGTLSAISGSGDDANINNNFAELHVKVDAILTALRNHGLIAP